MKSKLLVLSTALMLVLAGCSGNNNQSFTPASSGSESGSGSQSQATVTGVTLDKTELALTVGQTATLVATVIPAGAADVVWSSSSAHATVDDGLVTAVSAGPAVITASAGDYSASCVVTVSEAQKVDIAYSDGTFEFNGNEQPGKFVYWAGDDGSVSSATYNSSTQKYSLTYHTSGWAFWGVQVFYLLPYAEVTDFYDITWVVNSAIATNITVNGQAKSLAVGENTIQFSHVGLDANRTLNVQMAVNGSTPIQDNTITFGNPVVYDVTPNTYYEVKFSKDETVLKDIQVKSGKLVECPADPAAPASKVFAGWYDGETRLDDTQPITRAFNLTPKFINESEAVYHDVKVYDGSTLLATIPVLDGFKVKLNAVPFPFGYEAAAYFKDSGLTQPFNPTGETITAPISIYAKKQVMVGAPSYNVADSYVTHLADGSLKLLFEGRGTNVYEVQLNYALPTGTHSYTIDFHYSIDKTGADVQIYDGATKAGPVALDVGNNVAKSISFSGALSAQNKLTFELGGTPAGQNVTFVLHDITLLLS